MMLHYLLDVHVTRAIARGLQARDEYIVVWKVGDPGTPPQDAPDPDVLRWCEEHNFVLITNNRSTMPPHLAAHLGAGNHMPGIFILGANLSMGETIDNLYDAATLSLENEYRDQLRHLPLE